LTTEFPQNSAKTKLVSLTYARRRYWYIFIIHISTSASRRYCS